MALKALSGVIEREEFTNCKSVEEAKAAWKYEEDQVAQFVDEVCEVDPGGECVVSELYREFQGWTRDAGIRRVVSKIQFSKRLGVLGFEPHKGTGGVRIRRGLRLKPGVCLEGGGLGTLSGEPF